MLFNNIMLFKFILRKVLINNKDLMDIFAITNRPDFKGIETLT